MSAETLSPAGSGPRRAWRPRLALPWLAAPAVIYLLVALALPVASIMVFGFLPIERGQVISAAFTPDYLLAALGDPLVWRLLWRSCWLAVVTTTLALLLGYPVAYVISLTRGLPRVLLLVCVVTPLLTSILVRTYAWIVILGGRRGLFNQILLGSGLTDRPVQLLNTDWAVIIGMTQMQLPLMIVPLLAALAKRDRALENASLALGAGLVATFFRVIVPVSMPGIIAGSALVFAIAYTNFIVPQLLGGGNYLTLAVQVYEQTVVILDWTRAATLATILLTTCFAFVILIVAGGGALTRWTRVPG